MPPVPGVIKAIAVTSKIGSTCVADVGGYEVTVQVSRDLTVVAGDGLLVAKAGHEWFVVGRTSTAPPAPPAVKLPPSPYRPPSSGRTIISPVQTGSWTGARWRTDTFDTIQGAIGGSGNHTGVAFYGNKPRSLGGATVTDAWIRLRRDKKGGTNKAKDTTLWLVTESTRPAGAPTRTLSTDGPNLNLKEVRDKVAIPNAWAQAMVNGTAGGLAVYRSTGVPYVIMEGRGGWGPAWTLVISWKRSGGCYA